MHCVMAEAVRKAYRAGEDDEALEPLVLVDGDGAPLGRIRDGDYVIFYDIRGEREIELTQSFTDDSFGHFATRPGMRVHFVTMIQYDDGLDVRVAFPPVTIRDTLSESLSDAGLAQVKIAESEKATHLSFFFNGKRKEPFPGEERIVIPSPSDVENYGEVPELSIGEVTSATVRALRQPRYDFLVTNFANVDVVGHIENPGAIRSAVEAVDHHIGLVVEEALSQGTTVVVTADHGTVEKWYYEDGTIDTGHTNSPVPLLLIDPDRSSMGQVRLREGGELGDVAPTILQLLGVEAPTAMTGQSLLASFAEGWLGRKRRILLLIADGWGLGDGGQGDLIAKADTPVMDRLQCEYPFVTIRAAGSAVGMPERSVGNSESGHLHLGAGRRVLSDRVRIDQALQDASFYENPAFLWGIRGAVRDRTRLHLLGIVSFYSSHGSVDHLLALLRLAHREGVPEVYIHSMLGRRGEKKESGAAYIRLIEEETVKTNLGRVVSVIGRFWSLDREENWDRIEKTYGMLVGGIGAPVPYVER